jgi:hypothetical protein
VNVDEMDLAREALDVTPWRPEDYERARAVLRGAMAEPGPLPAAAPVRGRRFSRAGNRRHRTLGTGGKVGIGAGIAAVAAAVVVLAATSASQPAAPARSASPAPAATSKLVTLAARISATDSAQPGNASLQIVDHISGGKVWDVYYGLYTDGGDLYSGDNKQTLMTAVAQHANQADGADSEVAAARYAATGDLATARMRMIDTTPNDFFLSTAAREKIWQAGAAQRQAALRAKGIKTPPTMPTGQALQEQINNTLWFECSDALNWAGGNSEIRAGVLRLLSTIPKVTVTNSTTDGQPTLTITAGPTVFGAGSQEVLTVNATTGLPVSSVSTTPGVPAATETYQVSRVTLANIEAGRF